MHPANYVNCFSARSQGSTLRAGRTGNPGGLSLAHVSITNDEEETRSFRVVSI